MFSSGLRTQWSRHLHRAFALVGHVAVGARDAGARVDALAPHLELRVLRLEHLGAGLGVLPVVEAMAVVERERVVVRFDLLDLAARCPTGRTASSSARSSTRRGTGRRRTSASPAAARRRSDRTASLRSPCRQRSMLAGAAPARRSSASASMPRDEARPRHAQLHRLRDRGSRRSRRDARRRRARNAASCRPQTGFVGAGLHDLGVRVRSTSSLPSASKPAEHVAAAEAAVGRDHRRVAVQARARLRPLGHAPGLLLVLEHVGVAAPSR